MEDTLVLIKPDGVKRGLCGEIVTRFERRGFQIVALKMLKMSQMQASIHYRDHINKDFYPKLAAFMTSSPLVAMVVRGPNAIKIVRNMMGSTSGLEAQSGTIRGDYAFDTTENVIHGSDSPENAQREIANFFAENEIF